MRETACATRGRAIKVTVRPLSASGLHIRPLAAVLSLAALSLVFLALSSDPANAATTFTVNKTGDAADRKLSDNKCDSSSKKGKQCTLRAAIEEANDTAGEDAIEFDIGSGTSVRTIAPASELPAVTDTVTIDGYTQRGASENTLEEGNDAVLKVEIDGSGAGLVADGLTLDASDSTVKGLAINSFGGKGILILSGSATGNRVEGNFVGTDASGTAGLGNGEEGVLIASSDSNSIGGTDPAQRNVISGNDFEGVRITGSGSTGNSILSNEIFANGGLGIDLEMLADPANGVTANDTGVSPDTDTGPNDLQNFPGISTATRNSTTGFTTITGILSSNPDQDFLIQCFLAGDQPDGSGHGEGAVLLDTTSRSTGPQGDATFQCDTQDLEAGQEVTVTATNVSTGDTSEFADNEVVVEP